MNQHKKRVLVGMSGGIDSSAVCLMLQEQGYEVVGVTMRVWDLPRHFDSGTLTPHFIQEARSLAERLGIAHYVADERDGFRSIVVQNFIDEYLHGRTPNPCVMCNPMFKFRMLTEWADRLDCDFIATGHYVQLTTGAEGQRYVTCGIDIQKDQSYFLWRLGQDVLRRCIFPLGGMTKPEVRAYLRSRGYALKANDGESMEVCFIERDYRDFLRQQIPDLDTRIGPGKYVDSEGRTIGSHSGYAYYTIGQRKGLGIALGKPAFVLKINAEKNVVMLGTAEQLQTEDLLLEQWSFVSAEDFAAADLTVRIRYRSQPVPCRVRQVTDITAAGNGKKLLLVHLQQCVSAVTPGQSAVFYRKNVLVGGAYIASQRGLQYYLANT